MLVEGVQPWPLGLMPHHDGSPAFVSVAEPAMGDAVEVAVAVPDGFGPVARIAARSNPDREPRWDEARPAAGGGGWTRWVARITVDNPIHRYRFWIELADGRQLWLNAEGLSDVEPRDEQDFRLTAFGHAAPDWASEQVMYQIFPDRFARSAHADAHETPGWAVACAWGDPVVPSGPETPVQFYGGDLWGVIEHLDHLTALGVTLLYLTPFFPGESNHRYNASSFDHVDPLLGGDEALVALVEAAHARGMRVIGDLTSNHSGDAHEWFRAAHRNPAAPESAFYYFLDAGNETYASWLGVDTLPKFDWSSTELRRRFIEGPDSVVARWLEPPFSLDGWRVDVSNMTGRFRDDDYNEEVRRTIRRTMLEVNPDTILLGESTNDAAPDFVGDSWHGAMTYANFTRPLWGWLAEPGSVATGGIGFPMERVPPLTGRQFVAQHRAMTAGFSWGVRQHTMNALNTHDTPRLRSVARAGSVEVAAGLQFTLPGIPVVFAGDEFALTGVNGEHSRTPLPWALLEDGGSVAARATERYRALVALRRSWPALTRGGMRWVLAEDEAVGFVREAAEGEVSLLVLASRGPAQAELPTGALAGGCELEPVFSFGEGVLEAAADGALNWVAPGPAFAVHRIA